MEKDNLANMEYVLMPIQSDTSAAANQKREVRVETSRPFDSWAVTKNCKDPKRLLDFVEWCCTDEGANIIRNGVEGVHWEVVNGVRQFTDLGIQCQKDSAVYQKELCPFPGMPAFSTMAPDWKPYTLSSDLPFQENTLLTDRYKEVLGKYNWKTSIDWWLQNGAAAPTGLAGALNVDPSTDLGKTQEKMVQTRLKYSSKLIMAKDDAEFEQIYQQGMQEYDALQPAQVIDYLNKQLNDMQSKVEQYKQMQ